ncbi:MAG: GH92 family glycosyl hydrolase [Verrucomicrobiota bacterium]
MKLFFAFPPLLLALAGSIAAEKPLTTYVNPFLGTAPLTNVADIGFVPPWRVWAGLTFPGASLPNAMVQLSPITEFGSGAGYEYEDKVIHAFTHSNKGHWNLCHIPLLPVTGEVSADDFGSPFSHKTESAAPGYYQVLLERYDINAELTTTLRCGYHKYTYRNGQSKRLVANLAVSNERVTDWRLEQDGDYAFQGYQDTRGKVFFYARVNHKITQIDKLKGRNRDVPVINFADADQPLEIKIGLSFTSQENAKLNLEKELTGKTFAQVKADATQIWEALLSKIQVTGSTERQKGLFYSCLYRSFLWPALRSDVNGEFLDESRQIVKKNFEYYTIPSLWDDYRNKLVLLGMLAPKVTEDVIQSMIDRGAHTGFMPTFFHGDHAAPFIAGTYLRGIRGYDIQSAYSLLVTNATVEQRRGTRPHIAEYIEKGYVSTPVVEKPNVETKAKAGVTKTLEYAYDDYAVALLAKELKDEKTYEAMLKRSHNYTNQFDPTTGLMRGRLENGDWVTPFDAQYPYYEYLYREANAWQSSFFAPHDTEGLIKLYPSQAAFEQQLDKLFSLPWNPNHIAMNINSFIGQYCHGNQPDHGFPWLYYWVGKPEKSQAILNEIMQRFYGMDDGLTLCGMDDAGEMSAWYVFTAMGIYPYSPADPTYIISVPLFAESKMKLNNQTFTITKISSGTKVTEIAYNEHKLEGYFISHNELVKGKQLVIKTAPSDSKR